MDTNTKLFIESSYLLFSSTNKQ